jgi:secreted trypsin-like serine protease
VNAGRAALLAAIASLGLACTSEEAAPDSATSDLIGGSATTSDALPGVIDIKAGCTAAKIAPRFLLTAAHCVLNLSSMDPKYGPEKPVGLASDPAAGHVDHAVTAVHVHPAFVKKCGETLCSVSAVVAKIDAPDVALIELAQALEGVPSASVGEAVLSPGDAVVIVGFGCTDGVHAADSRTMRSLKSAPATIAEPKTALHEGSFVEADDLPVFSGNYALTFGPASSANASATPAGLCPGDSGGPLYAKQPDGKLAVVGVNANYTLRPDSDDEAGMPVTNWHTRLDDSSRNHVLTWLRSIVR